MKLFRKSLIAFVVMAGTMIPALGSAAPSFDSMPFKPTTDHGFYITIEGSQTLGRNKLHATAAFDFSDESLVLVNAGGDKVRNIIGGELGAHLALAYGILDWWNIGARFNFVPYQNFTDPVSGNGNNGARMGDIEMDMKFRLLDNDQFPAGISLLPFITFPSGSDSKYVGNGRVTGGAKLVLETARIGNRFSVSANVGAQFRKKAALSQGTVVNDQFLYGAAANFAFNEVVEVIAEIEGWTQFDNFFDAEYRPLKALGGVRFFPRPDVAITVGGGAGVLKGIGAPDFEVFLTIGYVPAYRHYTPPPPPPPPADRDGDGIPDRDDYCPAEAGSADNCGCPPDPLMYVDEQNNMIRNQKIYFDFDKSDVKPVSYGLLNTIADTLDARPDIKHVDIIGHTDSVGTDEYNQKLSERRANAVRDYLIEQGVSPDRLTAIGKGESDPIDTNDTVEGRSRNRRVQFEIDVEPRQDGWACEMKSKPSIDKRQAPKKSGSDTMSRNDDPAPAAAADTATTAHETACTKGDGCNCAQARSCACSQSSHCDAS